MASRKAALKELVGAVGGVNDTDLFKRDIFPRLGAFKLSEIMAVTGYSTWFCSNVRAGRFASAALTWSAVSALWG
jgi:hypothetical protein